MNHRATRTRRFSVIESLEDRRLFAVDIAMGLATTTDAQSVSVTYNISGGAAGAPLKFDFYRNEAPTADASMVSLGSQTLSAAGDLSAGSHTVKFLNGTKLTPDTTNDYIIAVANANGSVIESVTSNNETYFRTYMLGAVSHGRATGSTIPTWESTMATRLKTIDQYDAVIAFNWVSTSSLSRSGQAVAAGHNLAAKVKTQADALAAGHAGDVVDLHFIGHSRGAVVISVAMADLSATTDPVLIGSYIKATYLDPHPASSKTNNLYSSGSLLAVLGVQLVQNAMNDPVVTIPSNVDYSEVFYQHTRYQDLKTVNPSEYSTINLWGQGPNDGIVNQSSVAIKWVNLTTAPGNTATAIGHSEVPLWYITNVVDTGKAAQVV